MGRRGGRGGGPMPRDVQVSKKLSRLLRHSAEQEGLVLGPGGYVNLKDVLNTNTLRSLKVSFAEIRDIVRDNEKQRFSLIPIGSAPEGANAVGAQQDSTITTTTVDATPANEIEDPAQYLIRANQGHSIAVETDGLLKPLTEVDIPATCVHGTTYQAWPLILRTGGLKKMNRTHIHFAAGLPSGFKSVEENPEDTVSAPVISGMRNSSTILIYVDVRRAMDAGIAFFRSENGVILSAGGPDDVLPMAFFSKVEDRKKGVVLVKDGKLMEGAAETK